MANTDFVSDVRYGHQTLKPIFFFLCHPVIIQIYVTAFMKNWELHHYI